MSLTKLPFTHGIEMELQVVRHDGHWIDGQYMPGIFRDIVDYCLDRLSKQIHDPSTPQPVKQKLVKLRTMDFHEEKHNRGHTLIADYRLDNKIFPAEIVSRDAHGTGVTWILEIVTPPCVFVEELDWWCHQLFRSCHEAITRRTGKLRLISTGLNPLEEFSIGISFGDHHHIGVPDRSEKFAVYNMLRNFIPHLIALTVNSPMEGGKQPNIHRALLKDKKYILADRTDPMSRRLAKNTNQLGPSQASKYLPYLHQAATEEYFQKRVEREPPRMVDMYPFTKFGTIELRVFDAQLTTRQRIAIALLIQAIALRARKLHRAGRTIPAPCNRQDLVRNRDSAILRGPLIGMATNEAFMVEPDGTVQEPAGIEPGTSPEEVLRRWRAKRADPDFTRLYQEHSFDKEKKLQYLMESCQNLVVMLKEEFSEMNVLETSYLDPLIMTLWGPSNRQASPPLTPGHFQLFLLSEAEKTGGGLANLIPRLAKISDSVADQIDFDPMVSLWGKPAYPDYLKPVKVQLHIQGPESLYAHRIVDIDMTISNLGGELRDLSLRVFLVGTGAESVYEENIPIKELPAEANMPYTIQVLMGAPGTKYSVITEMYSKEQLLATDTWTGVSATIVSVTTHLGPDAYIMAGRGQSIPYLVTLSSTFPKAIKARVRSRLIKKEDRAVLFEYTLPIEMPPSSAIILAPEPLLGRSHDELKRMSPKALAQLGDIGSELFVIQGMPMTKVSSLFIPSNTPHCQAIIETSVLSEDGATLHISETNPFLITTMGSDAPVIRIEMEPLAREGWVRPGQKVWARCRSMGTFSDPMALTARWWTRSGFKDAASWTVVRSGEERTFELEAPRSGEGASAGEAVLYWNDSGGAIVGEERVEVRPLPSIKMQLGADSFADWPWIRVRYAIMPRSRVGSSIHWQVAGLDPLVRCVPESSPDPGNEQGLAEILVPPGIARLMSDKEPVEITAEIIERNASISRSTATIAPRPECSAGSTPALVERYIAGLDGARLAGAERSHAQDDAGRTCPDLLLGLSGNATLFNGAHLGLKPGDSLEYRVRIRSRKKEKAGRKMEVESRLEGLDGIGLSRSRVGVLLVDGRADAGPFAWTVPDNAPSELRLTNAVFCDGAQLAEKTYVLHPA